MPNRRICAALAAAAVLSLVPGVIHAAGQVAPGYPGDDAHWRSADKQVFATAYGLSTSRVWLTGQSGILSEVFYPNLSTPALRDLDFAVLDGAGHATRVSTGATHTAVMRNFSAPMVRQTSIAKDRSWTLTLDLVTDPSRATVLADTYFHSKDGKPRTLVALADPSLNNDGADDNAAAGVSTASAYEFDSAVTMQATPRFTTTSVGYLGASDGWTDVASDGKLSWRYTSTELAGNVVLTGVLPLDGLTNSNDGKGHSVHATIALGFADSLASSRKVAAASLIAGSAKATKSFRSGWQGYFKKVVHTPASVKSAAEKRAYRASVMVLAASEDKDNPGAFIASPTLPWDWASNSNLSGGATGYHAVWARDEYQMATAMAALGDRAAAVRAVRFLFDVQQKTTGGFPQNSSVDGIPTATAVQLDQVALPIVLAQQLGITDGTTWSEIKSAADYLIGYNQGGVTAPASGQERWEEQSGYSPSTLAAEIAGLVCAADIAGINSDSTSQSRYLAKADEWASKVKTWTATTTGAYSKLPYFIRLSKGGDPNSGSTFDIGNGGGHVDPRNVVDAGFLELVRLGIMSPNDATIVNTLRVVDRRIARTINKLTYFYRYTKDGYGESADGSPWSTSGGTRGRLWPLLSGERGEYALLAGHSGAPQLAAMAAAATSTYLIPEQVWDSSAPAGTGGRAPGSPSASATPLGWSHAQFIRLAWGISNGSPVEYPRVVACHFLHRCAK